MGPMGLKGDEGPRGAPGDPAKGVRNSFTLSNTLFKHCRNTVYLVISLLSLITTDNWSNWKKRCQGK